MATGDVALPTSQDNELSEISGDRWRLRGGWGLRKLAGSATVDRVADDVTEVGVSGSVTEVAVNPLGVLGVEADAVGSAIYCDDEDEISVFGQSRMYNLLTFELSASVLKQTIVRIYALREFIST